MTKPSTPTTSTSSSDTPVANGSLGQTDPTTVYAVYEILDATDGTDTLLAQIISTSTEASKLPAGFATQTEYWKVVGNEIQTSRYDTIKVTKQAGDQLPKPPFQPNEASFSVPGAGIWFERPGLEFLDCMLESQERYVLHFSYSKDDNNKWKGRSIFMNRNRAPLFMGEGGPFVFKKPQNGLPSCVWFWAEDTRP